MGRHHVAPRRQVRTAAAAFGIVALTLTTNVAHGVFTGSTSNPGNTWSSKVPQITVSPTVLKGPFPRVLTGTLVNFTAGESVTYRLDSATALTGTPTSVDAGGSATITSLSIPSVADGTHTVYAIGGGGSQASTTITVDTTAPTVSASTSPVANGYGWNNTSPVQVTLTGSDGGSGISTVRYTTDGTDPVSSGTSVTYSTPFTVSSTTTVKYYATDVAGNLSSVNTRNVNIDTAAPVSSIASSAITGNAYKSGSTVYYRGIAAGSLSLTNTVTDAASGPISSATAALGAPTTGWSHTASTVTTPAGGPYVSNAFTWAASTTSSPTETVTATDQAGNSSATTVTFVNDSTAPAMGSITYTNGYADSAAVAVTFGAATDSGSGVDATSAALQRATATLDSAGTCGSYSAYVSIATAPASPYTDATLSNMRCYKYRYVVSDNTGNTGTATGAGVLKVSYSAAVSATTGLSGYWRLGEPVVGYDSFTGTSGTNVLSHTGETGAGWTQFGDDLTPVVKLNGSGGVYRSTTGAARYYSSGTPPTADYTVEADLTAKSMGVANEEVGVLGRIAGGSSWASYYGYYTHNGPSSASWVLDRVAADGSAVSIGTVGASVFAVGSVHHVQLAMVGTTISLWADGVQVLTGTDSTWTATGHPGFGLGYDTAMSTTTGLHLSNYRVTSRMADAAGTSIGDYRSNVITGVPGALTNDADTAASFNGTSWALITDTTALHQTDTFTVEAWVKRADTATAVQTIVNKGSGAYKLAFSNNRLTLLKSGGATIATATSTSTDTTAFHHYAVTKSGATVKLYIDGVDVTGTVTNSTLTSTTAALYVGATSATTEQLNGTIDELAVYGQAVPAATIANHASFP